MRFFRYGGCPKSLSDHTICLAIDTYFLFPPSQRPSREPGAPDNARQDIRAGSGEETISEITGFLSPDVVVLAAGRRGS